MQFYSVIRLLISLSALVEANEDFDQCALFVRKSKPVETSEDTMLRVYALYKQAKFGDCKNQRAGEIGGDMRKKLNAWCALVGMPKEAAEVEYVRLIDSLVPDWRSNV